MINIYKQQMLNDAKKSRSYWRKNREWLIQLKESTLCFDCKRKYPAYVMQFDHRPGEKKRFAISKMSTRSRALIESEISKCDLVCANCHAIRTEMRRLAKLQPSSS